MAKVTTRMAMGAAVLAGVVFVAGAVAGTRDDRPEAQDRARGEAGTARCVTTPLKGSRIIDSQTVVVSDWHGSAAVLTLSGPCLKDRNGLVLIRFAAIGEQICDERDVEIIGQADSNIPLTCAVRSVELISRADAEARAPDRGVW